MWVEFPGEFRKLLKDPYEQSSVRLASIYSSFMSFCDRTKRGKVTDGKCQLCICCRWTSTNVSTFTALHHWRKIRPALWETVGTCLVSFSSYQTAQLSGSWKKDFSLNVMEMCIRWLELKHTLQLLVKLCGLIVVSTMLANFKVMMLTCLLSFSLWLTTTTCMPPEVSLVWVSGISGSPIWWMKYRYHNKGFQPEWYILTVYHCRDIPFWLETLKKATTYVVLF